jgi:hypothetical protein
MGFGRHWGRGEGRLEDERNRSSVVFLLMASRKD